MRTFITIASVVALTCGVGLAESPASRPATQGSKQGSTQPASKPAKPPPKQRFALMNGAVKFMVPDGWTETDRTDDEKNAQYHSADGKAVIFIGVVPQEYPVPLHNERFTSNMKATIIASMKQHFEDVKQEVLYGPNSETDDRFLLRIHDRVKDGHATLDQVHLYRGAGLDLLVLTTAVETESPEEARKYHTVGEDICLSMIVGKADKKKDGPSKSPSKSPSK